MDMLDTMASVRLMLSLRPRLIHTEDRDQPWPQAQPWPMASVRLMLSLRPRLIPIFCMEVMAMAMLDTLAMLDTMDTPMLDMPTMDKLQPPKQEMDRATIILLFFSDNKISVLDLLFGNGWQETQRIIYFE